MMTLMAFAGVASTTVVLLLLCPGASTQGDPQCVNDTVRLTVGGVPQNSSGQVEVCSGGVWGAVCDDNWDTIDAIIVCRQLGYSIGEAVLFSTFDIGPPRPIFLDEVGCLGAEATLLDCPNDGIGNHDCSNTEHAGVMCSSPPPECSDGAVRLTDGGATQNSSGQVEVCPFGTWGTVCDDAWDTVDATVVCRQLGFTFGVELLESPFDIGPPRDILLDEVACIGSEATLLDCQHNGIFNHDCSSFEHAGVMCFDPECSEGAVRLTDGGVPQNSSGQVEVCSGGVWGVVCDDAWGIIDALVVCRQLGYDFGIELSQSPFDIGPPRPIFLDEVGCLGSEATLLDCPNDGIGIHDCGNTEHAGVICRNTTECSDGAVRLTDGGVPQNSSGQVEVCQLGSWGVVCDDGWDATDASVVCRQFGFDFGEAVRESFFAIGPARPILLDDVLCSGSESSLLQCQHNGVGNHNCDNDEHAGVRCSNNDVVFGCINGAVRLTDGGVVQNSSGQVEVCFDGEWGVVCDDSWDEVDASVVCRQLGFSFGEQTLFSFFDSGPISILLDEVQCAGSEANLLECSNDGIGNHDCSLNEHAGAICYFGPECTVGAVRLTDGGVPQNSSGQVEVCPFGTWGTVCDDVWDARDATVVCSQFGYSFGEAVRKSQFAIGPPRPIFLDEVNCNGSDASLLDCPSDGLRNHDCSNEEHAGVICSNAPQCVANAVRLRDDGTGENDGTVEFCLFGQWETICDVSWTNADAAVVCRQLGRGTDGVTGRFGSEEDAELSFLQFDCNGNEPFLLECDISANLLACSSSVAGVSCLDRQVTGCSDGDIRLASEGSFEQFGRVEVCSSGVWGTVCDNQWDDNDATVVCRQLGYTGGVATTNSVYQVSTLRPVFAGSVGCVGTESRLESCPQTVNPPQAACSSTQFAGVACDNGEPLARCGEELITSEEFLRLADIFGSCEPFSGASQLCSSVFDASTSVYVPSRRGLTQAELASMLDNIILDPSIAFEDQCTEIIARTICQYFFPPCGSNNSTHLPIAICNEECVQVQDICSRDWNVVEDILEAANMETINCFATSAAVSPLPSCCTGADLLAGGSAGNDRSIGGVVGGVLGGIAVVVIVLIVIVTAAVVVMRAKRRKMDMESIRMSTLARADEGNVQHVDLVYNNMDKEHSAPLQASQAVPNPYSHTTVGSPVQETSDSEDAVGKKIMGRFSANFARQLSTRLRITRDQLTLKEKIGTGEFGVVYKALLTGRGENASLIVAVKTLKGLYDHNEIHKIMDESLKMKFFNHPNVLSLIGVCLDTGAAPYIIMPYMANGSLQQYLKKERANLILGENVDKNEVEDVQKRLTIMCLHIAQGMEYLAEQRFIHRDLAARNCMIDMNFVIKIADFGLSEDLYAKNYFRQEKDVSVKLPVKWMAPESLNDGIFSEKTDVWSFGVTCWEVFNGGKTPYPGVDPRSLCQMLDNGERLGKPKNTACPDHMFAVMQECWEADSLNRPAFTDLVREVSSFATNLAGYFDFSDFNPFQRPQSPQLQASAVLTDEGRFSPEQNGARLVTNTDSDLVVMHNQATPDQSTDQSAKQKRTGVSISERTKRFLPKRKAHQEMSTLSFDLAEEREVLPQGTEGAGIRINIQPSP